MVSSQMAQSEVQASSEVQTSSQAATSSQSVQSEKPLQSSSNLQITPLPNPNKDLNFIPTIFETDVEKIIRNKDRASTKDSGDTVYYIKGSFEGVNGEYEYTVTPDKQLDMANFRVTLMSVKPNGADINGEPIIDWNAVNSGYDRVKAFLDGLLSKGYVIHHGYKMLPNGEVEPTDVFPDVRALGYNSSNPGADIVYNYGVLTPDGKKTSLTLYSAGWYGANFMINPKAYWED